MITDHDNIDLSHQNVPQDENYPLKAQMPEMVPTNAPEAVAGSDLKTAWEMRADVEAETKRAKMIWQEDALVDLMRAGQKITAEILAQNSVKTTDIVVRLRDFETVYPEEADDFVGGLYFAAAEEIERLRKELDACAGNWVIEDD